MSLLWVDLKWGLRKRYNNGLQSVLKHNIQVLKKNKKKLEFLGTTVFVKFPLWLPLYMINTFQLQSVGRKYKQVLNMPEKGRGLAFQLEFEI